MRQQDDLLAVVAGALVEVGGGLAGDDEVVRHAAEAAVVSKTACERLGLVAHEGHVKVALVVEMLDLNAQHRAVRLANEFVGVLAHGMALADCLFVGDHRLPLFSLFLVRPAAYRSSITWGFASGSWFAMDSTHCGKRLCSRQPASASCSARRCWGTCSQTPARRPMPVSGERPALDNALVGLVEQRGSQRCKLRLRTECAPWTHGALPAGVYQEEPLGVLDEVGRCGQPNTVALFAKHARRLDGAAALAPKRQVLRHAHASAVQDMDLDARGGIF